MVTLPKSNIRVHLQHVTRCPTTFTAGHYWYGGRRNCPPKWIDRFELNENGVQSTGEESTPDSANADQMDSWKRIIMNKMAITNIPLKIVMSAGQTSDGFI